MLSIAIKWVKYVVATSLYIVYNSNVANEALTIVLKLVMSLVACVGLPSLGSCPASHPE